MSKTRNVQIDIFRAIAMLLVILGHTMTGCTVNSESSFLFRIVWSLQMPLFFLISGYVLKYQEPVCTPEALRRGMLGRTRALLLPYAVWMFLVRGVLFRQRSFLDIRYVVNHMDSGYWFLFSLWTIAEIFALTDYFSGRLQNESAEKKTFFQTALLCVAAALLSGGGAIFGFSFLGIKLSVYYLWFYWIGVLVGRYGERIRGAFSRRTMQTLAAVCLFGWLAVICCFDTYGAPDNAPIIILRMASSLAGSAALFLIGGVLLDRTKAYGFLQRGLGWVGRHTLELYLIHYLLLCLVLLQETPEFATPAGVGLTVLNFMLTLALSSAAALLLGRSSLFRKVLFGKKQ